MSPNKKDEKAVSMNSATNIGMNFILWLFVLGVICLFVGIVNLYLAFNFPPLDSNPPLDFLFGYLGWLYNWNSYLQKAALFLLVSAATFLPIIYVKYIRD
ncbi:MAG: hypothetical protein QW279_04930 [Candidatus Jordarchaeaceae archaeon]